MPSTRILVKLHTAATINDKQIVQQSIYKDAWIIQNKSI